MMGFTKIGAGAILLILVILITEGESDGKEGKFLWFGFGGGDGNKELKGVICPGIGNFAVKKPGGDNCRKYYECLQAFKQPNALLICGKDATFNRISRSCVPKEFENCKWCGKEGRHVDKTSKHHFIECVGGSIGIRYRCKTGKYDVAGKECKNTTIKSVTDVTVDVDYDQPTDIAQFMKDWKEAEEDEKEEKKTVSSSIEQGLPPVPEESEEKKDEDKEKEKGKKKGEDDKGKKGKDHGGEADEDGKVDKKKKTTAKKTGVSHPTTLPPVSGD